MYRIFSKIVSAWLSSFPEAESTVSKLVSATIGVYTTITTELLPTPAKSHYTFNLRDLSKVFQGMLMAVASKLKVRGGGGKEREEGGREGVTNFLRWMSGTAPAQLQPYPFLDHT
jgi:hypothetical protein